jgi:pimeloyl-ACP methyl ester carboxylesterase
MLSDYVQDGFQERSDGAVEFACSPDWEASTFSLARSFDPNEILRRNRHPVTIYRAASGSTCECPPLNGVMSSNPNVSVETITDTTHFLPMERPDLVCQLLAAHRHGLASTHGAAGFEFSQRREIEK